MRRALVAFARADARGVRREALLAIVLGAPVALAVALRFGAAPTAAWVRAEYGVDLTAHWPLVLALVVVLHVPMMCGMVGTLLVLDDLDDGVLRALRTSPFTLERYLGYRLASIGAASLAGLLVAVPLSGLVEAHLLGWFLPSIVLAALCGPLMTMAALSLATNKVEGLTVLKGLGIPFLAPAATWFVPWPADVGLAPLPTYWATRALWAADQAQLDAVGLAVGAPLVVLTGLALWRRVRSRLAVRS